MDVKTAFLNGDLTEEIYMERPEGLDALIDNICKLTKSLYGFKQAPKFLHEKFDRIIRSNGYWVSESDKYLYIKVAKGKVGVICLYVDDMLIIRTDLKIVKYTKKFLSVRFSMKDLGTADVILGIKILNTKDGIGLSQSYYIENMLKKYGYFNMPELSVSYDYNKRLQPNTGRPVRQLEYSKIILW